MEYVIDKYKVVCKNGGGEQVLPNVTKYTETVDFVYLTSITTDTSMKRGWRGDVRVDYILADTRTLDKSITTECKWVDLILIRIEATTDRNWKYVFAKR